VAQPPDFEPRVPGIQDTVQLAAGRAGEARVELAFAAGAFPSGDWLAPVRCAVRITANTVLPGNVDPAPWNNIVDLEISVADRNENSPKAVHESSVDPIVPMRVKIHRGDASSVRTVRVRVRNADVADPAGHRVIVSSDAGDCTGASLADPDFDPATPGIQNWVVVPARGAAVGRAELVAISRMVTSGSRESPSRCTAWFAAVGPGGDSLPTNDRARVVVDVVDFNDF